MTAIRPIDLHHASLVPVGAHWWAINASRTWMVRNDRFAPSLGYRADDDDTGQPLSSFKAISDASVNLLCTVDKVLVPVHGNAHTPTSKQVAKLINLPVPKEVWGQSQFFFESLSYQVEQASLFTCGDKVAVFNRTYVAQFGLFGEWHGDEATKPFFIVNKGELVAVVMPIRAGVDVPRFVFGPVDDLAG